MQATKLTCCLGVRLQYKSVPGPMNQAWRSFCHRQRIVLTTMDGQDTGWHG